MARPFRPRTQFGAKLTGFAFAALVRLLGASFRLRRAPHDPFRGGTVAIGALWHRTHHLPRLSKISREGPELIEYIALLGWYPQLVHHVLQDASPSGLAPPSDLNELGHLGGSIAPERVQVWRRSNHCCDRTRHVVRDAGGW